jgi:hypothetical protein
MKKNTNYVILGLIILAFIFRMLFEQFSIDWSLTWSYLSLFTIISTYYGLYMQRQNSDEEFDYLMDFKGGAQGGAMFAFGTGVFTFVFYKFINPYFLENFDANRRSEILDVLTQNGESAENIAKVMENHQAMGEMIYAPLNWSVITIAALTFLAVFYGFLFAFIAKFFPKFINQ